MPAPRLTQAEQYEAEERMQRILQESGIHPNSKDLSIEDLAEALEIINQDQELHRLIGERSYNHDNGFYKLVLLHTQDGYKVRIHVFSNGLRGAENFHNHRWAFNSLVIAGKLNFDVATVQENEDGEFEQWFYHKEGDIFNLLETGKHYDLDWKSYSHNAGNSYRMDTSTIHRITESEEYTATLVITEPTDTASCFQYQYRGCSVGQKGIGQKMPEMNTNQVKRLLKGLLNSIGGV